MLRFYVRSGGATSSNSYADLTLTCSHLRRRPVGDDRLDQLARDVARAHGSRFLPDPPGGMACRPEFLQHVFLTQGVHARPKSGMRVADQLALPGEAFERIALPGCLIAVDVI